MTADSTRPSDENHMPLLGVPDPIIEYPPTRFHTFLPTSKRISSLPTPHFRPRRCQKRHFRTAPSKVPKFPCFCGLPICRILQYSRRSVALEGLALAERQTEDWRSLYGASGPSADAPLPDRQNYLRLRYSEILNVARLTIIDILERKSIPDFAEASRIGMVERRLSGELPLMKQQSRTLRASSGPEKVDAVDIDAVAAAYLRREGLEVSEEPAPIGERPRGVPHFDDPPVVRREWALAALGAQKLLSDRLAKVAADPIWSTSSGGRTAIKAGQRLLGVIVGCIRDLSTLMAVTCLGSRREDAVRKVAVDDLEAEVRARQTMAGMTDPGRPRPETVAEIVRAVKAAREGDFWAYFPFVAYNQRSQERIPYELTPEHRRMYRAHLAHLTCKRCGEWHMQSWVPKYDAALGAPRVAPVTCPKCGLEDCAGPKDHFIHAPRGFGKTEAASICGVYHGALMQHRGYRGESLVVGSNLPEGRKRLAIRVQFTRTPGHRLCFPRFQTAKRHPGQVAALKGEETPSLFAYGIESLPPGAHAEEINPDDVVNERGMTHPAIAVMVESKTTNVIDYSKQPWTVLNWDGTPWAEGDADDRLEKHVNARPDDWTKCVVAVTGTYPNFISPWPSKWDNAALCRLWEKNEFAFRRAMMMERIRACDRLWHTVGLWVYADERLREKLPASEAGAVLWLDRKQVEGLRRVLALDPAFTDKTKPTKGRSQTAIDITGIDPDTHLRYALFSWSDFVSPGKHIEIVADRAQEYRVEQVCIEKDKMTDETAEALRAKGLSVDTYSPAALGGKHMRKEPVASAYNNRLAFIHGCIVYENGKVVVRPISSHLKLYECMLGYPGVEEGMDLLDAHEISMRKAEEYWGGPVPRREAAQEDQRSEFRKYRDAIYDPPPEEKEDSDAEMVGALAQMDEDAVAAMGLMED